MIKTVSKEVSVLSILTKQYISRGSPFEEGCIESGEGSVACKLDSFYSRLTKNPEILYYIQTGAERAKELFLEKGSAFIVGIPRILANIGIMVLSVFFFLKDSSKISRGIRKYIPLGNTEKRFVFRRFNELFYSIVYGNIITAFIQGCIAAVGLVLFGYPSPLIWGILTVFAAFIPVVGTGLVYLPLSLVQILMGVADSDNTMITRGIGFLLYGLVLVSNIDNLIRMKVIGDRASIHPLFVLIGVFGGLLLFGFVGIFIGPIILSLLFTFADLSLAPLQESHKQK
jgi:predicted PurR-regulated permease PerM